MNADTGGLPYRAGLGENRYPFILVFVGGGGRRSLCHKMNLDGYKVRVVVEVFIRNEIVL